jgi:hypothetical protein
LIVRFELCVDGIRALKSFLRAKNLAYFLIITYVPPPPLKIIYEDIILTMVERILQKR